MQHIVELSLLTDMARRREEAGEIARQWPHAEAIRQLREDAARRRRARMARLVGGLRRFIGWPVAG